VGVHVGGVVGTMAKAAQYPFVAAGVAAWMGDCQT
jgi:hypothetical protein